MDPSDSVSISCTHCKQAFPAGIVPTGADVTCPLCHEQFPFPVLSSFDICRAQAARLGYRCVDLDRLTIPDSVLKSVAESIVRHENIMPVALDGEQLVVAVSDPQADGFVDRLRFELERPIALVMAPQEAIRSAIDRCFPQAPGSTAKLPAAEAADAEIDFVEVPAGDQLASAPALLDPDSATVSGWLHQLIAEAFRIGTSRIAIRPVQDRVIVACRIQDAVHQRERLAPGMLYPVLVKLMTMVNLHGVVKVSLGGQERRLHASFQPTEHGVSALLEMPQDLSPAAACRAQAAKLGYRLVNLEETPIPAALLAMVPESVARQHNVLPVAMEGDRLWVVVPDPAKPDLAETLRFVFNRPVFLGIAPEGEILAAIDRHYGVPDPDVADLLLWELSRPVESAGQPAGEQGKPLQTAPGSPAKAVYDHLCTFCGPELLRLFESIRGSPLLCTKSVADGDLEVVFPQAHLTPRIPSEARKYLEGKIWALREAIIARLENFLERDRLAKGLAMVYDLYLACCQLAANQAASIDPAKGRDTWINFVYNFALHSFPSVDSNGTLLAIVTEHHKELSAKLAAVLGDPSYVVDPQKSRAWLARFLSQTITDEPSDSDNPAAVHFVEMLIAEALRIRASAVLFLPQEGCVEVAYRVQGAVLPGEGYPVRLHYPVLARLAGLAGPGGEMAITKGKKKRALQVAFQPTEHGLAALVHVAPDAAARHACQEQAAALGCQFVELEKIDVPAAILAHLPKALAWKKRALPVAVHGGVVTVVVDSPPGPQKVDELKLALQSPVSIALAPRDDLLAAICRHYLPAGAATKPSPAAKSLLATGLEK
jgi:type II secretory ATPase GspE/PulE/Tfp pilus assembly ATPase PilB-like protein